MLNKTTSLFTTILISLIVFSCNPSTGPEKIIPVGNCDSQPGTHNYSWRIDTIGAWPSLLGGVWAFSDSDAYAMGNLKYTGDNETYLGLHWNGKNWSTQINGTPMEIGHYSEAVTGDDNLMVSVGDTGPGFDPVPRLGEFNNKIKKWKSYEFADSGSFKSVWTDKKEFFIAGGSNGILYSKHSYNAGWGKINTPFKGTIFGILGYDKNDLFLEVNKTINFSTEVELWQFKNNEWNKLYDTVNPDSSKIKLPDIAQPYSGFHMYHCEMNNSVRLYFLTNPVYCFDLDVQSGKFLLVTAPFSNGIGNRALGIWEFSPNDIWFHYPRWYHWDGNTVKNIIFTGYDNFSYGKSFVRTKTGKVFLPMIDKRSIQVFVVAQGIPVYQ